MIIIINGSINSGKTTVSKLLVKQLQNTAHIEVDNLREFVDFMPLTKKLIQLNIENAALVTKNFIKHGLNVIISYPLSKENYDLLIEKLNLTQKDIFTFTLNPKLSSVIKNRGTREIDDWEVKRIHHHYEVGINNPEFENIIIDNTDQTPEETVKIILNKIAEL